MDKFFIREIAAVWAFNQQNEAVWKCSNVGKLKITQDGNTIRKKDAQGATIFKMDTAKSVNISFEVSYWDFNILSLLSGSEMRTLDGTANPYLTEPINVPYTETHTLTVRDINNGYIMLEESPFQYENMTHELSLYKTNNADAILNVYQENIFADDEHYRIQNNKLYLPESLTDGDTIEMVYEFASRRGVELINSANDTPETYKVRILMLISPICSTDLIEAVWITANNATPDMALSLDFGVEENIPVNLELGYSLCDGEKKLYGIVSAGRMNDNPDGIPLRTHDNQILYTNDQDSVRTVT